MSQNGTPSNNNKPSARPSPPAPAADDNNNNANVRVPTDDGNNNASPAPANPASIQQLPTETPMGIQLFVNLVTLVIALIVFVMLFQNIGEGYIYSASMPSDVTAANFSVEAGAIQLMTDGQIHFFIGTLLMAVVATALNISELFFPAVLAKHRVKQLVINRVASGLFVAIFLICLSSLPAYVARKNKLTTDAGSSAHAHVLAFWILLFISAPFVMLSHRLTPNENKRRFDRAGSMWDDEEYSPFSNQQGNSRAPDNY